MTAFLEWFMDFAGPFWYTIDFDKDDSFFQIPPEVIVRYGRHIRKAIHVAKEVDILSLLNPGITALTNLEVSVTHSRFSLVLLQDLARCHRPSLTTLRITGDMMPTRTFDEQKKNRIYLSPDAIGPSCRLTALTLSEVCIPRAAFSCILEFSPSLVSLTLTNVIFVDYNPSLDLFRHPAVATRTLPSPNILESDWRNRRPLPEVEALTCNPPDLLSQSQTRALHRPEPTPDRRHSREMKVEIHAADEVASSKRMVGRLLRSCHRLEVLSVKGHLMDVKFLEEQDLECRGTLKELRVRFFPRIPVVSPLPIESG
ncbi:hypothetical protein F5H01DRAFT_325614 [Linnemannia elongata]|nr:hypothetical protein F5H01DRAFT_325614 [Linnemannia elongata]